MKNVAILKYSLTVESLPAILTNRRSQTFYKLIDVHSLQNVIGESIFSYGCGILWISKVSIFFCCESVVSNLKEKKLPAQVNRNRFDLIIASRYRNFSTMENLRCLNSAVSAVLMKQFYKTLSSCIKAFCLTK